MGDPDAASIAADLTAAAGTASAAGPSSGSAGLTPDPEPPSPDESLEERTIMYNFEDGGWCQGVVMEINEDPEVLDGEEMADYIIYYEADNTDVPHALDVDLYSTDPDAPPNSWYLLIETEEH